MPEFKIRNVAIKLFPHEEPGVEPGRPELELPNICNNYCTQPPTIDNVCVWRCSFNITPVCWVLPSDWQQCLAWPSIPPQDVRWQTPLIVPRWQAAAAGDPAAELGVLKEHLRQNLAAVEEQEQRLAEAGKPRTVEEIDQLKAELAAAIDDLDAQREALQPGDQGPG